jgi:hypothetical protein
MPLLSIMVEVDLPRDYNGVDAKIIQPNLTEQLILHLRLVEDRQQRRFMHL